MVKENIGLNALIKNIFCSGLLLTIVVFSAFNNTLCQTKQFEANWESLKQYQTPEWFRDAKFGIWAHWGPQCQPEQGDWYARQMYFLDSPQYKFHVEKYGDPSKFGFKDVINEWKAENWNPEELVKLYKRAGAQYFFALANHHDNFDLWDSRYQPWNSTKIGPKKNIIGEWEKAARKNGLRFGVSVHATHTWTWYESAQNYDGNLTKTDGKGLWWEGLDPQDLYAQNHTPSRNFENSNAIFSQWDWENGASLPNREYINKFYNRTIDLIDKYNPDLLYFDDTVLPFYPFDDTGLRIASHFYNNNIKNHRGKLEAVLFGKILNEEQRKAMVWDIERGRANEIQPLPWQTDTCIGDWHYRRSIYEEHKYKSAKTVIQTLADVVSKNGNLLLNIPVRGDGTIDADERAIVKEIADWMSINKESIFGTRPWKVFGEGPASQNVAPLTAQGFNESSSKPFSAEDIRFTTKGNILYAIVLGVPNQSLHIKSLGINAGLLEKSIENVKLLGSEARIKWSQNKDFLTIEPFQTKPINKIVVFKFTLKK